VVNLEEAKRTGIKKGLIFGIGMGMTWLIVYSAYCLAFWYGAKLVRDSLQSGEVPPRYDGGTVIMVRFSGKKFKKNPFFLIFSRFLKKFPCL
jgi:ABC-type multidrug transport system fused ATPase/permease subunit